MAFAPSTPITGTAQTGLTTPTYTHTADMFPDAAVGKQYAVTALGGTQTGGTVHSVSSPFTFAMIRPKVFKALGKPNPTTGLIANVPKNPWKINTRHGVTPLAGQPVQNLIITTTVEVPAGSDTADAVNIRAALSCHFGLLSANSAAIGDTIVGGVM